MNILINYSNPHQCARVGKEVVDSADDDDDDDGDDGMVGGAGGTATARNPLRKLPGGGGVIVGYEFISWPTGPESQKAYKHQELCSKLIHALYMHTLKKKKR